MSRRMESKRIETEIVVGVSRDFFTPEPQCKSCGAGLVPDGLVQVCGNPGCSDYDPQ